MVPDYVSSVRGIDSTTGLGPDISSKAFFNENPHVDQRILKIEDA